MLKFYEDGHIYEYNGQVVPSVSELLRFMSREVYSDINKYVLDHAAARGTAVHAATQELDASGTVDCDHEIAGYIKAYAKFLREHDAGWANIEKAFAHPAMLYAGTIDRSGLLDGFSSIVDIKTNSAIKKPLVKAQLNGYKTLLEANGIRVERLYCLQLLQNERYRLYPVTIDDTEFMACYRMHTALKNKYGRGVI